MEYSDNQIPPLTPIKTELLISAPKQTVWNELVAFSEIDPPTEFIFKTGIAYPTHAEIDGVGPGATRYCVFTTGEFVEPITIWDEPNLLAFDVESQPAPMVEWSFYTNMEIEHLDGYFKSSRGQFELIQQDNGETVIVGTTWYQHNIWPSLYWKLWSDYILHQIHFRVLNHIKTQAELNSH